MNKCICGYELSADDAFCPQCGEKVKSGNEIALPKSEAVDNDVASVAYPELDYRFYLGFAIAAYAASFGLLAILLHACDGIGILFFLLLGFLIEAVNVAAGNMANMLIRLFYDQASSVPAVRHKALAIISRIVLAIPYLFPTYGAVKALYETEHGCVVEGSRNKDGSRKVWLGKYYQSVQNMNWLSLPAYKWVYRATLEHGDELEGEAEKVSEILSAFQGYTGKKEKKGKEADEPALIKGAAKNLRYQSPEDLIPGCLYELCGYKVINANDEYVIAMFDFSQDFKEKQAARALLGNGMVNLAELAESSSFTTICIRTDRKLCDGDSIPKIKGKYIGATDSFCGRLHTFREMR